MMASIYISDPKTGLVFTARAGDVDAGGQLTDRTLADQIKAGGWAYEIVNDFGLGANLWRNLTGGFGWGARSTPS